MVFGLEEEESYSLILLSFILHGQQTRGDLEGMVAGQGRFSRNCRFLVGRLWVLKKLLLQQLSE